MTDLKFDFNPAPSTSGRTQIQPDTIYTKDRDYGYEPNFNHQGQPFFFSAAVAPGNYRVTVKLGDPSSATTTTIKAEMRRLMLENIKTAPGQFITRSFVVNVRTPQIPGGGQVRLKQRERETEMINWDEKLTLEFNGSNPRVSAIEIDKVDVPTIYVMGDSTVCDQPREPWNSWGQMLPRWFNDQIVVANHANSGESLRSSMGAHRLDQVVSTMKSGDWLLIQFGHNDMKEKGEGIGAFTSYKTDLKHYIAEARKRGGQVILVTSMERKAGVETPTLGDYPEAVRQTAREEGLPLIDLNAMSKM
ncbi:MAG TPA: rhamnogalacturonan acetylesterase, partial [Tepidisphaeraceae bacterium]